MKKVNWNNWNKKINNFKKYKHIKSNLIYGSLSKEIPSVSIMVLTYKRSEGLKKALESALNQDYKDTYEIIVCDDSGYDEKTDKLMKQYCKKYSNIIYYRHKRNLGQYANWNRACELCRTNWYCLLHDDDQMKNNYLTELVKCSENNNDAGLIGSYLDTIDDRTNKKVRLLDQLIDLFIKLRKGKSISLSNKDNINHIFTLSCCLFINKQKYMELGGLDDDYYPSSDFVFSAKMNYFYKTIFLPMKLSYRGIGNNVSLKQNICDDSIICAYNLINTMCKSLNYSKSKTIRSSSIAAVVAEIGVKGYNNVDYGPIKKSLGMKDIYNNKFTIKLINIYSKFNWGKLLFRRK